MRSMVSVLAIATLMATIWTGTDGKDPNEEALLKFLSKNFVESNKLSAQLINTDKVIGLPFQKAPKSDENVVDLKLRAKPPRGEHPHEICGNSLGIKVNDRHVICNLHTISLDIYKGNEGEQQLRFILHFQHEPTALLKLYVPIFEVPAKYQGDKRALWKWVQNHRIEALGPITHIDLISVAADQIVTAHFGWLDRLVSYGLYNVRRNDANEFSAWTRPLVLPPLFIKEFVNVWNNFKGTGKGTGNSGASRLGTAVPADWEQQSPTAASSS